MLFRNADGGVALSSVWSKAEDASRSPKGSLWTWHEGNVLFGEGTDAKWSVKELLYK